MSATLFSKKGFEKTSIQDIITELGLSKGAVYHHFKSKDDILEAVMRKRFDYATRRMQELIANTQAANSKDRLIRILEQMVADLEIHTMDQILAAQIKNPQFVVAGIKESVQKDARTIAQIMIEGKADGSITTDYPLECAEVFMLLANIWVNPILFERTRSETLSRLTFLQQMMKGMGVDIVSDTLIEKIIHRYDSNEQE
ncbi:TetR/AcrR family transcriptional regulator [Saccharibacillus sacchari]|uniref:TetR/AcrR family transcriptional regulator n=1 Tax=Saccharibacillus sacchari TaxID=456493 RepID=UPI00316ADE17